MGKSRGGVRCSEPGFAQEMKGKFLFFLGIQRERLAAKVRSGEARFGPELDGEKPWRGQVFGARICARNERKVVFSRDSEGAFGSESAIRGGLFWTRIRWGKAVAGSGVLFLGLVAVASRVRGDGPLQLKSMRKTSLSSCEALCQGLRRL